MNTRVDMRQIKSFFSCAKNIQGTVFEKIYVNEDDLNTFVFIKDVSED